MIRIEGIPVIACRLRRERGLLISRTNVRRTSRVAAIGKVLIAVKAALQKTTTEAAREGRSDLGQRMDFPYAKAGTAEWHILHGLNPGQPGCDLGRASDFHWRLGSGRLRNL
jgi:hypothetical protein